MGHSCQPIQFTFTATSDYYGTACDAIRERDQARKWAATWKRAATWWYRTGNEYGDLCEWWASWAAKHKAERDSARRVARALYEVYRLLRRWLPGVCQCEECQSLRVAARVLREEAK